MTAMRRLVGRRFALAIVVLIAPVLVAAGTVVAILWPTAREDPPTPEPGRHRVEVIETRPIAPGPGLPPGLVLGAANNNLDVVRHGDHVYLALRTAPHHFASRETRILVLRSRDEEVWELDHTFALGHDLREPRLLSHAGRLVLFVSKLGSDPFDFEPQGMVRSERGASGWSPLDRFGPERAIGWRARIANGAGALLTYQGGGSIYSAVPDLRVDLWRSDDASSWSLWDEQHGPVYRGGGSEADFDRADGDWFGTIRVESGDAQGWGSRVCRAPAARPASWHCVADPRKYDSPYVFAHDGEVYLVGRRNLRGDGRFDRGVGPEAGPLRTARTVWNHLAYSLARKRCSLWRFVADGKDGVRVAWVLDLPSRGDTCFPAMLPGETPDTWIVYDYSSPLEGPDPRWIQGQLGPTIIHRHTLRFER